MAKNLIETIQRLADEAVKEWLSTDCPGCGAPTGMRSAGPCTDHGTPTATATSLGNDDSTSEQEREATLNLYVDGLDLHAACDALDQALAGGFAEVERPSASEIQSVVEAIAAALTPSMLIHARREGEEKLVCTACGLKAQPPAGRTFHCMHSGRTDARVVTERDFLRAENVRLRQQQEITNEIGVRLGDVLRDHGFALANPLAPWPSSKELADVLRAVLGQQEKP